MVNDKWHNITKSVLISAAVLGYGFMLIYFSAQVGESVVKAVKTCIEVIIPSLYCFMVLSGVIISSGLYKIMGLPFSVVSRYIFKLDADLFPIFLISCAAGYPVGAKMISDLYRNGKATKSEAERMLGFCYMGGPAFFCGTVGIKLYSSVKAGMLVFVSILLSNILAAVVLGAHCKVPPRRKIEKMRLCFSVEDFISSVCSGGKNLLMICAMIIFFASLNAVLDASGAIKILSSALSQISGLCACDCAAILKAALEISSVSTLTPMKTELLPIAAALLSFGGLCVVMQSMSILSKELLTNNFYIGRIISLFSSYFVCKIIMYCANINEIVKTSSEISVGVRQSSPIPSIFLLIMTILLLSNNLCSKIKPNVI